MRSVLDFTPLSIIIKPITWFGKEEQWLQLVALKVHQKLREQLQFEVRDLPLEDSTLEVDDLVLVFKDLVLEFKDLERLLKLKSGYGDLRYYGISPLINCGWE